MSGNSNVGNSGVYEANEQRTVSDAQIEEEKKENRFHEGKDNSHLANDPSTFNFSFPLRRVDHNDVAKRLHILNTALTLYRG
jgi:hypothetical protein